MFWILFFPMLNRHWSTQFEHTVVDNHSEDGVRLKNGSSIEIYNHVQMSWYTRSCHKEPLPWQWEIYNEYQVFLLIHSSHEAVWRPDMDRSTGHHVILFNNTSELGFDKEPSTTQTTSPLGKSYYYIGPLVLLAKNPTLHSKVNHQLICVMPHM